MTLSIDPPQRARCKPSCSPRHRSHCSADHLQLVEGYRDARDARDALRESGAAVVPAAHAFGAAVAPHQLEDSDFDAAFPPVTFKDWLLGHAGRNRQPEQYGVSA